MRVLVSGFKPFDGGSSNPSEDLIYDIQNKTFEEGLVVKGIVLPVEFESCFEILKAEAESFKPDVILSYGLAGVRDKISLEQVAINLIDARIPDNVGVQPKGQKIASDGEDGLFTKLPIRAMAKASEDAKIPTEISFSAGTYICNYTFYQLNYHLQKEGLRTGFIHIPKPDKVSREEVFQSFISFLMVLQAGQTESFKNDFGKEQ
ncbi:MAG: pyroglutamyl-peptidase I [Bacteriovoracaceae bacterium]